MCKRLTGIFTLEIFSQTNMVYVIWELQVQVSQSNNYVGSNMIHTLNNFKMLWIKNI